ncbi:TolC family protein [Xenophilus aerolatus]|nr:TolC family protein [Xenophilus aerolatus]
MSRLALRASPRLDRDPVHGWPRPVRGRWRPFLFTRPALIAGAALALAGCASVSPQADRDAVQSALGPASPAALTGDARAQAVPDDASRAAVEALLREPLDAQAAVRIALLQSPRVQQAFATLQLSDAERARAATLPNPVFSFGRLREGRQLEIDRALGFDVLGLLTLPWQARWAGQRHEVARLEAAQQIAQVAADARRAWVRAVAAQQGVAYLRDARDAADTGAALAQRMAKAGNWSTLRRTREELLQADAAAQLARAEQAAVASREQLTRLLGLPQEQAASCRLPDRLPPLPVSLPERPEVQATALRERLDVRAAQAQLRATADAQGLTRATRFVDALEIGAVRNSTFANDAERGRSTERGVELSLPIPLFDWGQARSARAEALYLQSAARVRATAVQAASEAREAHAAWQNAWQVAHRYQAEVLPLRQKVNDEMLLRYNGMLASVWELLAEAQASALAVNAAMAAQRDFWLADTDLLLALTGASPAGLSALQGGGDGDAVATAGGSH